MLTPEQAYKTGVAVGRIHAASDRREAIRAIKDAASGLETLGALGLGLAALPPVTSYLGGLAAGHAVGNTESAITPDDVKKLELIDQYRREQARMSQRNKTLHAQYREMQSRRPPFSF